MPQPSVRPPQPGLGWIKDREDRRDRALYATVPDVSRLPEVIRNAHLLPEPFDQHAIGSCVGWSVSTLCYTAMVKDGRARPFMPSPVFVYREARELGGYVEEDAGAEIRLAMKVVNKFGLPPMSNIKPRYTDKDLPDPKTWLFPETSIWRRRAAPSHWVDAERRQVVSYHRLTQIEDMIQCLADGNCFVLGFAVFPSFYGPGGVCWIDVPEPKPTERSIGGHAVLCFGVDRKRQRFHFRNSWGKTAHQGSPDFTLSYEYVARYAGDVWAAVGIEGAKK